MEIRPGGGELNWEAKGASPVSYRSKIMPVSNLKR